MSSFFAVPMKRAYARQQAPGFPNRLGEFQLNHADKELPRTIHTRYLGTRQYVGQETSSTGRHSNYGDTADVIK